MASIYKEIRSVFETTLAGVAGVPDIAWENVNFNPSSNQNYIRARLIPTTREPAHRGLTPQMYYQGYYLIECYTPDGLGPSACDDLADLIIDNFEAVTDLTFDGTTVPTRYAERDQGIQEGAHYMVAVRIGWYLYA